MPALDRLFDPKLAFMAVLAIAVSQYAVFVASLFGLSADYTFGGDFAAFWSAAKETLDGGLARLYASNGLERAIQFHSPHQDLEGLTWQYPPHAALIFSPIGLLPFSIAYAVWCAAGLAVFAYALWSVGLHDRLLVIALASIPVLLTLKTGQNALFMGALLLIAVFNARSNPIVAGIAAALLTTKPQLGLLLPVFFIAAGHWRALIYASLGSVAAIAASIGIVGVETWIRFFEAVTSVSGAVATGDMPVYKMVNVYAAAQLLGVPDMLALSLAAGGIMIATGILTWVSRASDDPKWHYAALAVLTLIAAPYSYYYELVLIVPALIFVLERGYAAGWLRFERESVSLIVLLTLVVPGLPIRSGVSINFFLMALITFVVLRRLKAELAPAPAATLQPA